MDISSQPFKILTVDDSAVFRKLVEQSLSGDRYNLFFAKDGREALALFAEQQPPVVITDWDMPDIGGLELCRRIRRDFQGFYSHLILLSGNTDKEHVIEGLAAGADDYLTKPFHAGELVARVEVGRRIVQLHRQIQAKNRLLEEMTLTDSLTCLPNRRALDIWAPRQLSAAARHGFSVWVVMADLDLFKKVNDTYGHDAGDTVLKSFATILKANTRESDICIRLGGEEFLVMIAHGDVEDRIHSASGLRESATNRLGEHGGYGLRPDAAEMQTFSTSRLIVGGLLCRAPDACFILKGARMSSPTRKSSATSRDVLVRNEGTVFVFCALTAEGEQWINEHVHDALWFGSALVVEHRYAWSLAVGMQDEGLVLA